MSDKAIETRQGVIRQLNERGERLPKPKFDPPKSPIRPANSTSIEKR